MAAPPLRFPDRIHRRRAQRHARLPVAEQARDDQQRDSLQYSVAGERVTQVMKPHLAQVGFLADSPSRLVEAVMAEGPFAAHGPGPRGRRRRTGWHCGCVPNARSWAMRRRSRDTGHPAKCARHSRSPGLRHERDERRSPILIEHGKGKATHGPSQRRTGGNRDISPSCAPGNYPRRWNLGTIGRIPPMASKNGMSTTVANCVSCCCEAFLARNRQSHIHRCRGDANIDPPIEIRPT